MATDENEKKKKKTKRIEALTTAGCGYGNAKKRVLDAFWNGMWPKLLEGGWTKIDEAGPEGAATYFVPNGVNVRVAKKGRDFYDKVISVIKRIMQKGVDKTERDAALAYSAIMKKYEKKQRMKRKKNILNAKDTKMIESTGDSELVAKVKQKLLSSGDRNEEVEVSISCSRVGNEYQASIPKMETSLQGKLSGAREEDSNDTISYATVWDPYEAIKKGVEDFVHLVVPHNKKEAAMVKLHQRNYVIAGLFQELTKLPPSDCCDWIEEEKHLFRETIFEKRKQFHEVAKVMGKSVHECITYYLSHYKYTDDYHLLKTIRAQELNDKYVTKNKENNETPQKDRSNDKDRICLICGGKKRNRRRFMDHRPVRQHQQNMAHKNLDKEVKEIKISLLENAKKTNAEISKKRKADSLRTMNHLHDEKDGKLYVYNDGGIVGGMVHDLSSRITEDDKKDENESTIRKDSGILTTSSDILAFRKFASSINFIKGHEQK